MTTIELKLKTPRVPNYIGLEDNITHNRDGGAKIHISKLSEEQLREIGKQWTEDLIAHSKMRGGVANAEIR